MTYEIIAIIIGPLVAVFTVYMEYVKDIRIKLQDRKQRWLVKHYNYIGTSIRNIASKVNSKYSMVYNGGMQAFINSNVQQGMYEMTIINNLFPLIHGDINEHLKSYLLYGELIKLYNKIESYSNNFKNLYNDFKEYTQENMDKYFNGNVKPRAYSDTPYEIYDIEPMFYAVVYSAFNKNDFEITATPGINNSEMFKLGYKNGESYPDIFTSKSKTNAEIFGKSIMPDIISHFKERLVNMGNDSETIQAELINIAPKLLKITGGYNSGFPVKGECENCRSIKSVKRLEELMPPD